MSKEVYLDARLMPAPEPFEQATAALAALAPGQFFHMLHRMAPRMLYLELAAAGLNETTLQLADDKFHIVVWPAADPVAAAAAELCCKQLHRNKQI